MLFYQKHKHTKNNESCLCTVMCQHILTTLMSSHIVFFTPSLLYIVLLLQMLTPRLTTVPDKYTLSLNCGATVFCLNQVFSSTLLSWSSSINELVENFTYNHSYLHTQQKRYNLWPGTIISNFFSEAIYRENKELTTKRTESTNTAVLFAWSRQTKMWFYLESSTFT